MILQEQQSLASPFLLPRFYSNKQAKWIISYTECIWTAMHILILFSVLLNTQEKRWSASLEAFRGEVVRVGSSNTAQQFKSTVSPKDAQMQKGVFDFNS